jgi:hypothetical protein
MPDYAVLIFEGADPLPEDLLAAHAAHPDRVAEIGGRVKGGVAIDRPATATTVRDGAITDGPFVEVKEGMTGLYVLEARDLDHALECAALTPILDGGVEVRPLIGFAGPG